VSNQFSQSKIMQQRRNDPISQCDTTHTEEREKHCFSHPFSKKEIMLKQIHCQKQNQNQSDAIQSSSQ